MLSVPCYRAGVSSVAKCASGRLSIIPLGALRLASQNVGSTFRTVRPKVAVKKSFFDFMTKEATDTPFAYGRLAVAGGAALGVGALCFYGLGLSREAGALDQAALWPQYVRDRIHSTYMYLGGGLGLTAGSAALVLRSPTLMNLMTRNSLLALIGTMAAMMGTGMLCRSIPYMPENMPVKLLSWATHCAVMGAVLAPLALVGGPVVMRAAVYTAGIVGGLSAIAACAPSDKFMNMGGILGIGFGAVFAASIGSFFLPPNTMAGAGLYSIALYGGLLLFSGFMLYDTQRMIRLAQAHPNYSAYQGIVPYDPINAQLSIYMNTLNIFIRMVMILSGGSGRRK